MSYPARAEGLVNIYKSYFGPHLVLLLLLERGGALSPRASSHLLALPRPLDCPESILTTDCKTDRYYHGYPRIYNFKTPTCFRFNPSAYTHVLPVFRLFSQVHPGSNKSDCTVCIRKFNSSSPYSLSLSLAIRPYCSSLLAGPLDCIKCPHRADAHKSLLVDHLWHIHKLWLIRERCL